MTRTRNHRPVVWLVTAVVTLVVTAASSQNRALTEGRWYRPYAAVVPSYWEQIADRGTPPTIPLYSGLQITATAHILGRVPTGETVGTVVFFSPVMGVNGPEGISPEINEIRF